MATATPSRPLEVRAQLRYGRFSPYKAREVLDLIRGKSVAEARSILQFTERACSVPIMKVLDSAVANAGNNNDIPPDELFVSACFADEGPTLRRFRPRARGRGARIRKRTCHVTIVLGRLSANELERARMRDAGRRVAPADARAARARRVARSRGAAETVDAVEAEETTEEVVENTFAEDAIDSGQAEAPEIEIVEDGITPDTAEDAEADATSDEADVETEAEGGGDAEEPAVESDETDAESNEKDA
jgi:large subunit ribosomal protein L22